MCLRSKFPWLDPGCVSILVTRQSFLCVLLRDNDISMMIFLVTAHSGRTPSVIPFKHASICVGERRAEPPDARVLCVCVHVCSCVDVYQHVGVGGRLRWRGERKRKREGEWVMMLREEKGGRTVCSEVRERERKGKKRKRQQERERRGGRCNCL